MKFALHIYKNEKLIFITEYACTWHQCEVLISQLKEYLKDKRAEIIAENGLPF